MEEPEPEIEDGGFTEGKGVIDGEEAMLPSPFNTSSTTAMGDGEFGREALNVLVSLCTRVPVVRGVALYDTFLLAASPKVKGVMLVPLASVVSEVRARSMLGALAMLSMNATPYRLADSIAMSMFTDTVSCRSEIFMLVVEPVGMGSMVAFVDCPCTRSKDPVPCR